MINDFYNSINGPLLSDYFSVDNFNKSFSDLASSFSLCNYNVRSFNSNHELFFGFLQTLKLKFNLVILTETRFSMKEGLDFGSFSGHHSGRAGGGGGGVSVYFSDQLICKKGGASFFC